MRLHISADLEGIAGVAAREQLGPPGHEYAEACRWMTATVTAAIEAAREQGVTEVVVADSHGNALNLLPDRLPDGVQLVRGWPRPLGMMQGVEQGPFIGTLLLGYHGSDRAIEGGLAHTLSGRLIQEVRLNGRPASEAVISAAIAGQYGVPVLLVSGDDVCAAECTDLLGPVETAVVKWTCGAWSSRSLTPPAADAVVRDGVRRALAGRDRARPFLVEAPIRLEVEFRRQIHAEVMAYMPGVTRTAPYTVALTLPDMAAASRALMAMLHYNPTVP